MDIDPDIIRRCGDPALAPAIVERFIAEVAAPPLAVTVTIDGKPLLVPKPTTSIEAADMVAAYAGKAQVRFGLTQVLAGTGKPSDQIGERDFELCANMRMGTQRFARIYLETAETEGEAPFVQAVDAYLGRVSTLKDPDETLNRVGSDVADFDAPTEYPRQDKSMASDIRVDLRRLSEGPDQ